MSSNEVTALGQEEGAEGFSWESRYRQSWEILKEDSTGQLEASLVNGLQGARGDSEYLRKRRAAADAALRRSIMRHLVILLDWSLTALTTEVSPNRGVWTIKTCVKPFLLEYFEQNPLSQACIVILRDGLAERLCEFSPNVSDHQNALDRLIESIDDSGEPKGKISLQNGLEVANTILSYTPSHGSREVLLLQTGLSTLDPGNIFSIIPNLVKNKVRVSVVALSGEVAIAKKISKETSGSYVVALDDFHFAELVMEQVKPPSVTTTVKEGRAASYLVNMGFPLLLNLTQASLCACHSALKFQGFKCPRCKAFLCQIPADCSICGLTLISAPHLAKSYHHLFPPAATDESAVTNVVGVKCNGCDSIIGMEKTILTGSRGYQQGRCRKCNSPFCSDCSEFIHEQLYNCPGCTQ